MKNPAGATNDNAATSIAMDRHVTAMYDQAPIVDITSPAADIDVEPDVTSITISGTNNAEVIGSMRWNSSSGSSGSFAATSHWEISNIPISFGDNLTDRDCPHCGHRDRVHEIVWNTWWARFMHWLGV